MTGTLNKNFIKLSWEDVDECVVRLANRVRPVIKEKHITKLCAITRGGMFPAALLARELDLRYIDTICVRSYDGVESKDVKILKIFDGTGEDFLIVDEIVETGNTIEAIRKHLPAATFATVFATAEGKKHVDFYEETKADDDWIMFPWEKYDF